MPHITVEYSTNLEPRIDVKRLVEEIHAAVVASNIFELGAIRTRAEPRALYVVADGDPDNGFIHVALHIGPGRDAETRRRLAQAVLDVVAERTRDVFERYGLGISVEITEIDNTAALRLNNLHARMKAKV